MGQTITRSSAELAADTTLAPIWDPSVPFPMPQTMLDPDVITHVNISRATADGYHYLHESAITAHQGELFLCWANHRVAEYNIAGELLRGCRSSDGITWSAPEIWAKPGDRGSNSFNHPVLCSHQGALWGFFTRWNGSITEAEMAEQRLSCCNAPGVGPQPATDIVRWVDGAWQSAGEPIDGFVPFNAPIRMRDGNWIIGGEFGWHEAAVAISEGDDFSRWRRVDIRRPASMVLLFPETTVIDLGDRLVALCRPKDCLTAPVATSSDCGQTWTELSLSNFPLTESQPLAGVLSTGQRYLVTCNLEASRALISIALTAPGETLFSRIYKVRHQEYPVRRHFPGYFIEGGVKGDCIGKTTEWSYPSAIEHDGKLYISYTQGKEDCVLSIIPISVLAK